MEQTLLQQRSLLETHSPEDDSYCRNMW